MTGEGRPLRFLVGVIGGWTLLRAWMLWPAALPMQLAASAQAAAPSAARIVVRHDAPRPPMELVRTVSAWSPDPEGTRPLRRSLVLSVSLTTALASVVSPPSDQVSPASTAAPPLLPGTAPLLPTSLRRSRWSGSAWALLRGGTGAVGAAPVSQLGGAQAGFRINYALDAAHRVALTARVSAPLSGPGREAGLGVAWRPTRAPVTLIAEQRVSLDGGRGGPALFAIAGLNPTPVAAGFRLEAYGEAGAVKRERVEAFADGAARLTRPLGKGPLQIDFGLGAWGGAQPGAARLDIGPSLGASLPVTSHSLRLTLDWRERVAGGAKPGSGPALTVGTDF